MASKSKSDKAIQLFVKILWGGADLGTSTRRLDSVRSIRAGRGLLNDIRSQVWPLREDITIVERDHGKLYLNPDLAWDGVVHTGKDLVVLDSRHRTRRSIEITSKTSASLRLDEISIAIRVGKTHQSPKMRTSDLRKFPAPTLGLIADTSSERVSLAVATCVGVIMIGALAAGMQSREIWNPETIADIPAHMQLRFIAPAHFETAPSVLQDKLDRFHYVDSVSDYYHDLATMMTNPKNARKESLMFVESVKRYREMSSEQSASLEQLYAAGKSRNNDILNAGGKVLGMPVVIGESLDGSLQRTLNKVGLVQQSAKELADLRVTVGEAFKQEPGYDYGSAVQATGGPDQLAEFTKKLGASFRNALPDEEQQLKESRSFAIDATAAQVALFGKDYLLPGASKSCCPGITGIKAGATAIDFTNQVVFPASDEHLAALRASTWGSPVAEPKATKIIEPIAGTIDPKAVERAIASGRFQLQLCFELALRRNQAAKGNMEWSWRIDSRGKINGLSLVSSTLKDEELVHCVRNRIAGWKFPKPKGGSVEIRYPFEFVRDKG